MSVLSEEIRFTLHMLACRSGHRCEWCGKFIGREEDADAHHRRPRGMGGTKRTDTHDLTNLVLTHHPCHLYDIETNRDEAEARGFLVPQNIDPATVPIVLASGRRWRLDRSGLYVPPSDGVLYAV